MSNSHIAHEHTPAHELMVRLTHASQGMGRVFSQMVGVSMTRMELLHEVWHAGEISQNALTQRLGIDGSLVTRFVKQMEAEGLVTRRADPQDNRFTLVSLADAGNAELERMQDLGDEFQALLLKGFSERDIARMAELVDRMIENLSQVE